MKRILLIFSLIAINSNFIFGQIDTANGRYYQQIFPNVTLSSNIVYGSNTKSNNTSQTLLLDIYEPTGDTVAQRPLIILAHGGSFIGGTKTEQDMVEMSNRFAKMGYVVASIEYRVGFYPFDSINAIKAVIRAVQDMKASIRFFRKAPQTYRIHPNYIFAGGSSAGAFMGLHTAYMDKEAEAYQLISASALTALGGLDGNSGNPGYSSKVSGVINLCGAMGLANWIEAEDPPFVSTHGTQDGTVPYGTARIYVAGFPIMVVEGSSSLKIHAATIPVVNPFHTYEGAGHVPYLGTSASQVAYMDTTIDFVRDFLRPLLGGASSISVNQIDQKSTLKIFPNPVHDHIIVSFEEDMKSPRAEVYSFNGAFVKSYPLTSKNTLHLNLDTGVYFIKILDGELVLKTEKIVVN
ncbi:MAG: carboxylesterase family protein [Bacteroidetes bacterium]|nr:carboxylesterase family protein [Bacteroidota bacterium]HET6243526.1 T9SS type A sorting domain-containing protein [Bacteroidia bacterium]